MKISSAFSGAFRAYRQHFGDLMKTLLVELAVGCMALTPLLFLTAKETAPLAWLCIPLFLLLVLPLRQNAAEAMQDMLAGGAACTPRLISGKGYFRKLLRGLRTLLWTLPLLAGVYVAYDAFTGNTDGFTLMRTISQFGGGDLIMGVVMIAAAYLATLLPILFGMAFHCGTRHAAALGSAKLLRGHRCKLMLSWILLLLPYVPVLGAIVALCGSYIYNVIVTFSQTFALTLGAPPLGLFIALGTLVLLQLLITPLRALVPAVYMKAVAEEKSDAQA